MKIKKPGDFAQAWQDLMLQVVAAKLPLSDVPCFEVDHHYGPVTHEADVSCCSVMDPSRS